MKRFASLLLAFALFICLFPAPSYAANEVFVATNNMILPLTDAMPTMSGGAWYVDYKCFTSGDLKVSSSYNSDSRTLVLYTWDTTLVFNLSENTAYNTSDNIKYSKRAFASNGTYYVPAQFTASQLGFKYSYIESASCIRFRSTSNLTDEMFSYIVKSKIPELLAQYNASKSPSTQITPPESSENSSTAPSDPSSDIDNESENQVTVQKRVYLTFDVTSGDNIDGILDMLNRYRMSATFFLNGNILAKHDNAVRRIAINGHALGIRGFSGEAGAFSSVDSMLKDLNQANSKLFEITRMKSRIVRIPGGSSNTLSKNTADALVAAGYRYWDYTLDANAGRTSPSASRISSTVINALNTRSYAIIRFTDSAQTVSALPKILSYLKENNCVVSTISVLDSPNNTRRDSR